MEMMKNIIPSSVLIRAIGHLSGGFLLEVDYV
jgi:hypothetical protein